MESNKKISTILESENDSYSHKKDSLLTRLMLLKNNSIDENVKNSLIYATPIYLIEGITLAGLGIAGRISLPISNTLLPGIIISSSLVGGILVNTAINKFTQSQVITDQLTNVGSEQEVEEEIIRSEIELAKINNRSIATKSKICNRMYHDNQSSLTKLKEDYESLKIEISNELTNLDTITTKTYLINKFSPYFYKKDIINYLITYPLAAALILLIASGAPLIGASINLSVMSNIVIPLLVGEICGLAYETDRIIRNRELFKKLNNELGIDKIDVNALTHYEKNIANNQVNEKITDIFVLIEKSAKIEHLIEQGESKDRKETDAQPLENTIVYDVTKEKPLVPTLKP